MLKYLLSWTRDLLLNLGYKIVLYIFAYVSVFSNLSIIKIKLQFYILLYNVILLSYPLIMLLTLALLSCKLMVYHKISLFNAKKNKVMSI